MDIEEPKFFIDEDGEEIPVYVRLGSGKNRKKEFVLDDEKLKNISVLYSFGLSFGEVASAIGVSESAFKKICEREPRIKQEMEGGWARNKAGHLRGLTKAGHEGNAEAAKTWLFLKGREVSPHLPNRVKVEEGEQAGLSSENRLKEIVRLNNLLIQGGVVSKKQKLEEQMTPKREEVLNNRKHILRKIGATKDDK